MAQRANPVCVRVTARRARVAGGDVGRAHEEAAVLVVDHDVARAVGTVALHAAARLVQVFAVLELAFGLRERNLQWRQLHDAVKFAIGEPADDAGCGRDHYDEHREARDSELH